MKPAFSAVIQRFRTTHKAFRFSTYLLIIYIVYALLLGLLAPAVIESQAPKALSELLGRPVQVGEVRINPFLLRVEINQFSIEEAQSNQVFFGFNQLKTELNFWQSVWNTTPTLDYFNVLNPRIYISRVKSDAHKLRFNFSDIPEYITSQQSTVPSSESSQDSSRDDSKILPFRAKTIHVSRGELVLNDDKTDVRLAYQGIEVQIDNLDTRAMTMSLDSSTNKEGTQLNPAANLYNVSLNGSDKSQISLDGQFQIKPLEVRGKFAVDTLQLAPLWPLSEGVIKAVLERGNLSLASHYHVKQQGDALLLNTEQGRLVLSKLRTAYQSTQRVKFDELALQDISISTQEQRVKLDSIRLDGLWVMAELHENGVDLQHLFTPNDLKESLEDGPSEQSSKQDPAPPWLLEVGGVEVVNTELNLKDELISKGVYWRLYPLDISSGKIDSTLRQPIDYSAQLGISSARGTIPAKVNGSYSVAGSVDVYNKQIESHMELSELELSQFQPYLSPYLNIELRQGRLSSKGDLVAASKGNATFNGELALDGLLIRDTILKEPLLKWTSMTIDNIRFDQQGRTLALKNIRLQEPYAKVVVAKDLTTNVATIVKASSAEQQALEQKRELTEQVDDGDNKINSDDNAYALTVDKVMFENGSAFFADYSMTPNFASGIELINGTISNLSPDPDSRAKVDIQGKIDRYAPVELKGELNPLSVPPYLDLDFSLDSAELTSVNPYSGTYAGYYIDKGQLSLKVNYRLEENHLEGTNHVVVDQLTLGKKVESEQATSLPVTLAVGLLKDNNGVIDLGFDVAGDVDSPEFSFGAAIVKVLSNIITKAVTAPFSLLADLMGSDEELDYVLFSAGTEQLDDDGEKRLSILAKALETRPSLVVSVEGSVLAVEDSYAMAEIQLKQKLLQTSGMKSLPEELSASRVPQHGALPQALESLYKIEVSPSLEQEKNQAKQKVMAQTQSDTPDPQQIATAYYISLYNQLISAQEVTEDDLGALAHNRAKSVKNYLVQQKLAPSRVYILDSKTELKTEQRHALLTIDAK